jgi:hypothetical protein
MRLILPIDYRGVDVPTLKRAPGFAQLKSSGQRTRYVETMYLLDLALDRRTADIPLRDVPWGRLEAVLKELNLECLAIETAARWLVM